MTIDRRDQILDRLAAIAATMPGVTTSGRDIIRLTDAQLPAISILEGAEELAPSPDFHDRPTVKPDTPMVMQMNPHVVILASNDAPDIGTTLNTIRAAMIKAVLTDADLRALCRDRTGIRYEGLRSDLAWGRKLSADVALLFRFMYVLRQDEL